MKVLVTGGGGFIGAHLWRELAGRAEVVTTARRPLSPASASVLHLEGDLEDEGFLSVVADTSPEAVVHLAASTDPEACEGDPSRARRMNESLPERLARAVAATCRRFVYVSTDLVFDGERGPYSELDPPRPLSTYGATKLRGEEAARSVLGERVTVVRLALTYGARADPGSRPSFAERMIRSASKGESIRLFSDELRTPLYVPDAARCLSELLERERPPALLHLGGPERLSRLEMGLAALEIWHLPRDFARAVSLCEVGTKAARPRDVSLDGALASELGLRRRGVVAGLSAMKRDMERQGFMVGS